MDSFLQVQHHARCYRSKRARKGGREGSRYRRTGLGKLNKDMTPGQSRSLFHIYLQLFSLFAIKCFPPKFETSDQNAPFQSQNIKLSVQFNLVALSCLTLCDPMDCSTPGVPIHHQLLELAQIHVHQVGDAIKPSHPLSIPSLLHSIFPIIRDFCNESVLCIRWPQYWSFSFDISPSNEYSVLISLGLTEWISLQSKGVSRVFSNTTVQKDQFFSAQLSV